MTTTWHGNPHNAMYFEDKPLLHCTSPLETKESRRVAKGIALGFEHFGVSTSEKNWSMGFKNVSSFPSRLINPDRWYHVAGTWDGKYQRIYLDGKLRDSVFRPGQEKNDIIYTDCALVLGSGNDQLSFVGQLAEVRMWNISRTPSEIYEAHNKRVDPQTKGLIGLWRNLTVSEGQDPILNDLSGHQPAVVAGTSLQNNEDPKYSFPPPQEDNPMYVEFRKCGPSNSSLCSQYINSDVAVNSARVVREDLVKGMLGLASFLHPACIDHLQKYLCHLMYRPCHNATLRDEGRRDGVADGEFQPMEIQAWIGEPPCASTCSSAATHCLTALPLLEGTMAGFRDSFIPCQKCDCGFLNDREEQWVPSFRNYDGSNFVSDSCQGGTDLKSTISQVCPAPLVNKAPKSGAKSSVSKVGDLVWQSCDRPCPAPIFPVSAFEYFKVGTSVISLLSFVGCVTWLVLQCRNPESRKFPRSLILQFVAATTGLSFGLSLTIMDYLTPFLCHDQTTEADSSSGLCVLQSLCIQFFALTQTWTTAAMCHNMWRMTRGGVTGGTLRVANHRLVALQYHLATLLPPFLSTVALLIHDSIGLSALSSFCWIKSGNETVSLITYYGQVFIVVIYSVVLTMLVARIAIAATSHDPNATIFNILFLPSRTPSFLRVVTKMWRLNFMLTVGSILTVSSQLHVMQATREFLDGVNYFADCYEKYLTDYLNSRGHLNARGVKSSHDCSFSKPQYSGVMITISHVLFCCLAAILVLILHMNARKQPTPSAIKLDSVISNTVEQSHTKETGREDPWECSDGQ